MEVTATERCAEQVFKLAAYFRHLCFKLGGVQLEPEMMALRLGFFNLPLRQAGILLRFIETGPRCPATRLQWFLKVPFLKAKRRERSLCMTAFEFSRSLGSIEDKTSIEGTRI